MSGTVPILPSDDSSIHSCSSVYFFSSTRKDPCYQVCETSKGAADIQIHCRENGLRGRLQEVCDFELRSVDLSSDGDLATALRGAIRILATAIATFSVRYQGDIVAVDWDWSKRSGRRACAANRSLAVVTPPSRRIFFNGIYAPLVFLLPCLY